MKSPIQKVLYLSLLLAPAVALANTGESGSSRGMTISQLVAKFATVIIDPLLLLLSAIGVLVFVFGLVEFMMGLATESFEEKKEEGKQHMLYGLIGLFIIFSAAAILGVISQTICGGGVSSCVP